MKRIVFLLIFLGFIDSAICQEPEQTTFINQPLVTEFENEPVVKYKITRLDCATYFSDDLDNPQYIFDESFDAVVTYYYQENRERLLICTDVTWNRLIYTYEKFPGPPLENEYEIKYFGTFGGGITGFYNPMGIDATTEAVGGLSGNTGLFGAPDENDLHIFVADYTNHRIKHLLYRHDVEGGVIFPHPTTPHIRPNQAGSHFPQMENPIDVTCDPFHWADWGLIYVLTADCYIRSINLNTNSWGTAVVGGYGGLPRRFKDPKSICARQGYLVAVDARESKVVLYLCHPDRLEYRDAYYFDRGSLPHCVTIDQFRDVLVADHGKSQIHKLHINDEGGGSLEYLTSYGSFGSDVDQFRWMSCVTAGVKGFEWARASDIVVLEEWDDVSGVIGYLGGADVLNFNYAESYENPGDQTIQLDLSFLLTGPVVYDLIEVRNPTTERIYPPDGEPLFGEFSHSGPQNISVELNNVRDPRGEYVFRIKFDSKSERFPTGNPVVQDVTKEFTFDAGFYTDPPNPPQLSDPILMWETEIYFSWSAVPNSDYSLVEWSEDEENWSNPIKTPIWEFTYHAADINQTYFFRVRAANNRGISAYSNTVCIDVGFPAQHEIVLAQGWNLVSSYVSPLYENEEYAEVPFCVQDIEEEQLVKVVNTAGEYYSPYPYFNNIDQWEFKEGYKIKVLDNNQTMIMRGRIADPETPIDLAIGWSYIAYLMQDPVFSETAVDNILNPEPKFDMLKDDQGHFFAPQWQYNDIGDMKPGEGYQINMLEAATLIYNDGQQGGAATACGKVIEVDKNEKNKTSSRAIHYSSDRTDFFFPILVTGIRIRNYELHEGDELAAVNDSGLCVGASRFDGSFPFGLVLWRDDTTTNEIDGYIDLEELRFRFWASRINQELEFDRENFEGNRIQSVVSSSSKEEIMHVRNFSSDVTFVPNDYFIDQNYPNPFNSITSIKYGLKEDTHVELKIFDVNGREVATLINENKEAGYYSTIWDGNNSDRKEIASGLYFYRINAGNFKKVKKMTLVK